VDAAVPTHGWFARGAGAAGHIPCFWTSSRLRALRNGWHDCNVSNDPRRGGAAGKGPCAAHAFVNSPFSGRDIAGVGAVWISRGLRHPAASSSRWLVGGIGAGIVGTGQGVIAVFQRHPCKALPLQPNLHGVACGVL